MKRRELAPKCACGCGQSVKRGSSGSYNNYVHGHNSRNLPPNNGQFKTGNTHGKGRPQGSRNKVSVSAMNLLQDEEQALSRRAIESALNGNTQMLQFCLSCILPPPPKDTAVNLTGMPACNDIESATQLSSFVLDKLSTGHLTPSQASLVSGIVEKHLRCLQITEVEQRLEAIENMLEEKQQQ